MCASPGSGTVDFGKPEGRATAGGNVELDPSPALIVAEALSPPSEPSPAAADELPLAWSGLSPTMATMLTRSPGLIATYPTLWVELFSTLQKELPLAEPFACDVHLP